MINKVRKINEAKYLPWNLMASTYNKGIDYSCMRWKKNIKEMKYLLFYINT